MKKKGYTVAVAGATGMVGGEMLSILGESEIPVDEVIPLASERSMGKEVEFRGNSFKVKVLEKFDFNGVDFGLFSPGGKVSEVHAPRAGKAGCVVIDNTSAFRMEPDVPLIVPEVNPHAIADYKKRNIISNPNCSTIQMVLVLKPIHEAVGIKRVVVSTYQATSGAGRRAMDELAEQSVAMFNQKDAKVDSFPHRIAFNILPHIGPFLENGYSEEEMKMVNETKKILEDPKIMVTATTARVPVFCGHSESVNIETRKKITAEEVRELLEKASGIEVVDDPSNKLYPMPKDCVGKNETFVGRIRNDISIPNGIDMWIVSDNLRKGAALNTVQIAEILVEKYI